MAEDIKIKELERCQKYLESLAEKKSTEMFSVGGLSHASVLMSVLFQNTKRVARVYSVGFRSELIPANPNWNVLKNFVKNPNHELLVLVEHPNCIGDELLSLLNERKTCNNGTIQVRKISENGKKMIVDQFGQTPCSFMVFDNDKYRIEYDIEHFKSFGSFNQPDKSDILIEFFDDIFNNSSPI